METAIPKDKQIDGELTQLAIVALKVTVTDQKSYLQAAELFKDHKAMDKKIVAFFKPHKEAAHAAHKSLTTAESAERNKLLAGMGHLNQQMAAWRTAEAKRVKDEEDRLQREAKERAEQEQLDAAQSAEDDGDREEADAILDEEIYVPPVVKAAEIPKVSGMKFTERWTCRVVDESKIPREYLIPNYQALNSAARSLKKNFNIAGCVAESGEKAGG